MKKIVLGLALMQSINCLSAITLKITNNKNNAITIKTTDAGDEKSTEIASGTTGNLSLSAPGDYAFLINEQGSEFGTNFDVQDNDTLMVNGEPGSLSVRLDRPRP